MSYAYQDGDLTTPQIDGPRRWLRPFDDDFSQYVFEQDYQQFEDNFAPLNLDTASDDFADAYLVRESQLEALGGGVVKWTRTYSRLPASRQVFESYSWIVPGIGSGAVYAPENIDSVSTAGGVTTITAGGDPTISVGDQCSISYTFTDGITGTQYGRTVLRTALTGTSGGNVNVSVITEPGGTLTFQTIKKVEPGRAAEALEVGSMLQLDYFLPGVSAGVSTPFDIPIIEALEIYDGDGVKTSSFTASTSPTLAAWRTQVAAADNVCVTRSVVRRWLGNIYERTTRYCVAQ